MYKKISVVDDDKAVHEAIRREISGDTQMELVSCHTGGVEALRSLLAFDPAAVIMDIRMPTISGIKVTQRLKLLRPSLAIVMFTGATDRHSVFASLIAGADG